MFRPVDVSAPLRSSWLPRMALVACATAFAAGGTSAFAAAPSTLPLVQQANVTYLGAFALPKGVFGDSSFDYGGHALAPYKDLATGKNTLFLEGHAQKMGRVAQVEIPASFVKSANWDALPVATVLQNFADVTDGKLGSVDPTNGYNPTFVYGLLPYNGRLIVGASNVYSSSQLVSHGVSGLTLSNSGDFKGFYSFTGAAAPTRALGGPMAPVPPEWQSAFGGVAITGQFGLSVVGSTSSGPAVTVFNPDTVGSGSTVPGNTLLYFPLTHPACGSLGCEATQNTVFNLSSGYGGVAFPPGTRSVLFVGAQGIGPYCYGTALACNDPFMSDVKGPHAPPYRYQIWAYDANDLVAVKNGTKQSWEPRPYAQILLNEMPYNDNNFVKGAAYDANTGHLYITQDYGSNPRVEVYQIKVDGVTTAQPMPPTAVSVQ